MFQNSSVERHWPGNRQAMPTMATGSILEHGIVVCCYREAALGSKKEMQSL